MRPHHIHNPSTTSKCQISLSMTIGLTKLLEISNLDRISLESKEESVLSICMSFFFKTMNQLMSTSEYVLKVERLIQRTIDMSDYYYLWYILLQEFELLARAEDFLQFSNKKD